MSDRRAVLAGFAIAVLGGGCVVRREAGMEEVAAPYGLIGKMTAHPGKRAELIAILGGGTAAMPGCLAYLIAEDAGDAVSIWITEIWENKAAHDASLQLPAVRDAIQRGKPLIAGFELSVETRPVPGSSFIAKR